MENEENGSKPVDNESEIVTDDNPTGADELETVLDQKEAVEEKEVNYTSEIIETKNFTLEVSHQITAGDILLSTLLAVLIGVTLLSRLIRS